MDDRELLVELRVDVGYIKTALEELKKTAMLSANKYEVDKVLAKHDSDIDNLKAFRYWFFGCCAAVSAIVTIIIEFFGRR